MSLENKYFAELARRLRAAGITAGHPEKNRLTVLLNNQPVLSVSAGSDAFLLPAGSNNMEASELYHRVAQTADEVYAYVEAVQSAPLLHASGLSEQFHLLADFGGAVLAGRELENGWGYQFVTWIWDYSRTGVSHGHYYEEDFCGAKQDFAVRSGLISKAQLFSLEERAELYRATDYLLDEGPELEDGQLKALQTARTKIEYTVPDLANRPQEDIPSVYWAALYLLASRESLWKTAVPALASGYIDFHCISCRGLAVRDYPIFYSAKRLYERKFPMDAGELASRSLIDDQDFLNILYATLIARYGKSVMDTEEKT